MRKVLVVVVARGCRVGCEMRRNGHLLLKMLIPNHLLKSPKISIYDLEATPPFANWVTHAWAKSTPQSFRCCCQLHVQRVDFRLDPLNPLYHICASKPIVVGADFLMDFSSLMFYFVCL